MHAAAAAEYSADGQSLIQHHLQHTLTHTDNSQIRTTIYRYKYGHIRYIHGPCVE